MNPSAYSHYQQGWYARSLDLNAVMRRMYLWLAAGLALGFGVAYTLGEAAVRTVNGAGTPMDAHLVSLLYNPVTAILSVVAYLGIGLAFGPVLRRASVTVGAALYLIFAVLFGFMISTIFLQYAGDTIFAAFVATAAMFAVLSLIGYTTKLDLSRFGAILLLALIGIIAGSLVNFFLQSAMLYWAITYLGVVIFSGLIAYDTQWIKRSAVSLSGTADGEARLALLGAFRLFLDFVNLFLFLLRIFGGGRR